MLLNKPDLSKLSEAEKRALISKLLAKKKSEFPLSYGQEALWFIQSFVPENTAYNVGFSLRIKSPLNLTVLKKSISLLVNRHDTLRSQFVMGGKNKLRQVINPKTRAESTFCNSDNQENIGFDWQVTDVRSYACTEIDAQIKSAYNKAYDLKNDKMLRVNVFECCENESILLLTVHHIAIDGWSLWQILDELQYSYSAILNGRKPLLPKITASYQDHVMAERMLLKSKKGEELWSFWQQELSGELPILQLATDKPRPPEFGYNGDTVSLTIGKDQVDAIRRISKTLGVTPFIFLLALYQVLLHRYSGQDDILVATPSAGRNQEEFANVVGYFVNPLPIRADFSDKPSFNTFVSRVKDKVFSALENEGFPLPLMVEKLQLKREPSYPSLCQALFVHQKPQTSTNGVDLFSGRTMQWGTLEVENYPLAQQEGQFDISLEVLESESEMTTHWKFNRDIFFKSSIEGMAESYTELLKSALDNVEQNISHLNLLDQAKISELTPAPLAQYDVTECLHTRFDKIAQLHDERYAVSGIDSDEKTESLNYQDLERRANQLANYLGKLGVPNNTPVGLSMDRSIDLVASILAILKAGCCYVPLDPHYPADRLEHMAEDSGLRFVICKSTHKPKINLDKVNLLCIDTNADDIDSMPDSNPLVVSDPDQLAYILYTSGSTGKPKGVKVSHRNVMRLFKSTEDLYNFKSDDVWSLFHSYAFDFSVWEIWGALLYGGKIVVVPYLTSRSPQAFYQFIIDHHITVLNQTPPAFQQLVTAEAQIPQYQVNYLRWVIFGGEALDIKSLTPWFERHGDKYPALVNMYGITETTVHVTHRLLTKEDLKSTASVIGQPLNDLQLAILDENLNPVPHGVPGELYVGGDGVSQGYHNRNDLTEERFIKNPFSGTSTLYKSGDLVRRIGHDDIEYIGRVDNQIQLRGFRIELGEIEAQINAYPGLSNAIVILDNDKHGDRLIAYSLVDEKAQVEWPQLREFLQNSLPDYMLPATGILLEEYPLTVNGKVDRKALPLPSFSSNKQMLDARDELEQQLRVIWQTVLDIDLLGIEDNFFELGGHSLLAVQVVTAIEKEFSKKIDVSDLFRCPTIAEFAAILRKSNEEPTRHIKLQAKGDLNPIFAIPGGGGNSLYYQPLSQTLGQDRPFYGLQSPGLDGKSNALESLEAIAENYIREIKKIQPTGPYLLTGHCFGGLVAYEIAQQLIAQGDIISRLIVMDVPAPYPIHQPPALSWSNSEWLVQYIKIVEQSTGATLNIDEEKFNQLTYKQQLQCCKQLMEQAGVIPPNTNVSRVEGILNVFKTNSQIKYKPSFIRKVPITLLRADTINENFDYSAADDHIEISQSSLGWRKLADSSFEVQLVPGDHISMLLPPQVANTGNCFKQSLSYCQSFKDQNHINHHLKDNPRSELAEGIEELAAVVGQ